MRKEIEEERNKTLDHASNSPATVGNRKVDQAEWSDVAGRARSGRGRERVSVVRVDYLKKLPRVDPGEGSAMHVPEAKVVGV